MTDDVTCPRCEAKTPDGLLCDRCLNHGRNQLRKIAQHWDDLYVHRSGGGSGSSGYGARIPITDAQTKVSSYVRNQLATWVTELSVGDMGEWVTDCWCQPYRPCPGRRRWVPLADDPIAWCDWLAKRMQRVRSHAAGDEAIDEFDYCAGLLVRAISPRRRKTGCGTCPVCGDDVFALDDDPVGTCRRCEESGVLTQMPRLTQRQDLWEQVPNRPLPRRLLMEAMPMHGIHVRPATFRQWVARGRLKPVGEENGAPLYLLADVRKLLADDAA